MTLRNHKICHQFTTWVPSKLLVILASEQACVICHSALISRAHTVHVCYNMKDSSWLEIWTKMNQNSWGTSIIMIHVLSYLHPSSAVGHYKLFNFILNKLSLLLLIVEVTKDTAIVCFWEMLNMIFCLQIILFLGFLANYLLYKIKLKQHVRVLSDCWCLWPLPWTHFCIIWEVIWFRGLDCFHIHLWHRRIAFSNHGAINIAGHNQTAQHNRTNHSTFQSNTVNTSSNSQTSEVWVTTSAKVIYGIEARSSNDLYHIHFTLEYGMLMKVKKFNKEWKFKPLNT